MIRAILYKDGKDHYIGFSAKGHSDYAEEGYDIVCAGASVLGCTCVNSLESVAGVVPVIEENDSGILAFHLPQAMTEQQRHDAQVLMSALRQGLADLAEQFPQDIKLTILNGGKKL